MKRFTKFAAALLGVAALSGCAVGASSEYKLSVKNETTIKDDKYVADCCIIKKRGNETLKDAIKDTMSFSPTGARIVLEYCENCAVDHDDDGKPEYKVTLPGKLSQYDLEIVKDEETESAETESYSFKDEDLLKEAGIYLDAEFDSYTVGEHSYPSEFFFDFSQYMTDDLTKVTLQLGRYNGFVKSSDLSWSFETEHECPVVESTEESKDQEIESEEKSEEVESESEETESVSEPIEESSEPETVESIETSVDESVDESVEEKPEESEEGEVDPVPDPDAGSEEVMPA